MPLYRFRIIDKLDRVVAGQFSYVMDDNAARKHADFLAAQTGRVEIFNGQRQVPGTSAIESDHVMQPPGPRPFDPRRRPPL